MSKGIEVEFPEKLSFLFVPHRYKGAKGGRGSGKSWSFARALLVTGRERCTRILCAREVQKSIKDSVHQLLKDQIEAMGLSGFYSVLTTEIRGANGTQILFTGLAEHTVDTIKSYEGVDICWVEEAQAVSRRSWDILIPTIRKDSSEIWFTYNPDLETDETHQRFAINPPQDCVLAHMNYNDNKWFNKVLDDERKLCQVQRPDDYDNIWLGKCRPAVEGAIYYKEIQKAEDQGRICNVPYDPMLRVHVVVDLGWNDSMSIALVQRHTSEIRVIRYIEDSHRTIDDYSAELKQLRYNWGKVWLPHDGFSGDVKTGKTVAQIMKKLGWDVPERDEITELSVEDGIRVSRMAFHRFYIDKTNCERLVECLKRYRRRVSRETGTAGNPLHDDYSHGADCFRYICLNADSMTNEDTKPRSFPRMITRTLDAAVGY
jgi:phage terminase large subunit